MPLSMDDFLLQKELDMANNQLTNEIERKAREILKTMSATEIEEKANQERKSAKINRCIWSAVLFYLAIFGIVNLCIKPIGEFANIFHSCQLLD